MSEWRARRFWTRAQVVAVDDGYAVALDGRPVKTPAKAPLVLPARDMAEAVAAEWQAQEDEIDPRAMPVTRSANAAIDRVAPRRPEVAAAVAAYGETDLLCYRADGPAGLVARQAAAWDPLLAWAAERLGAELVVTAGVMYVPQPPASLARLRARVDAFGPFALTALHDLVELSGSLVIGLAVAAGWGAPDDLWGRSRIDECWQAERWGEDAEAARAAAQARGDFLHAARFLSLADGASPEIPA